MTGRQTRAQDSADFTEAELRLIELAISICPQYNWMRVLGAPGSPDRLSRRQLRKALRKLPAEDRRYAYQFLREELPDVLPDVTHGRFGRRVRRWRRRFAAELFAVRVRISRAQGKARY